MKFLRNLLFFLLFFLFGFFSGIQFANIIEAGKGQMLAGGAIVLGYGVVGAILGSVVAFITYMIYKKKPKVIITINKILAVLIVLFWILIYWKYQEREKLKNQEMGSVLYHNDLQEERISTHFIDIY